MKSQNTIETVEGLAERVRGFRADGRKVVMCHGVFDLLHVGHIRHLEQARKLGDALVVTVTPDRFVNKGCHRPAFTEALRAEALAALDVVDCVAINSWPTAVDTIRLVQPDVFCKGGEYRQRQVDADQNMGPEVEAVREIGAQIKYTNGVTFSSSQLLNRYLSPFPPPTASWLEEFREAHTADDINRYIETLSSLKVLVVGEAIIDEYVFCDAMGKSTKDPVLACKYTATEAFAGGSLAIANHLAGFCQEVGLVTYLGETDRREEFIRKALLSNVDPVFVTKQGAPTIHKRRFVDQYSQTKLLELYVMDDRPLRQDDETALLQTLDGTLAQYDVVIAADYGHGMMTPSAISCLCEKAPFLAVNAQSNAGNRGFNPISRYARADYVCLAQHEVGIETRMREGDPRDLLLDVAQRIDCERFTVTQGKNGSLHYDAESGFTKVPAFATQVTDRVGAGDATFALTSLLVSRAAPWDVVGFVGNVSGAQMVTELGNRVPVGKVSLAKHIISLLK